MFDRPEYAETMHVIQHLRPASKAEMFFTAPTDDPEPVARFYAGNNEFQWVGYYREKPAAIIGGYPMWPGVWGLYGFGTKDYARILRAVTKHAIRFMMPAIIATGAHRAQCISPADHIETHRWLEWLGAHKEAELRAYGRNGEDAFLFAWLKD